MQKFKEDRVDSVVFDIGYLQGLFLSLLTFIYILAILFQQDTLGFRRNLSMTMLQWEEAKNYDTAQAEAGIGVLWATRKHGNAWGLNLFHF